MPEYVEPPRPQKDPHGETRPWLMAVLAVGDAGRRQLDAFIAALPANLPAAVLVTESALHRHAVSLPNRLRCVARLPVVRSFDGERWRVGVCYAPEPRHGVEPTADGELRQTQGDGGRHAGDQFLRAAAAAAPRVVGVILGPAAVDGAEGLAEIARRGGRTLVGGVGGHGAPHGALGHGSPPQVLAEAVARFLVEAARA